MLKLFYQLSSEDVKSLVVFTETCNIGQNYRINYLWQGERVHYVLKFLEQTGFVYIDDVKTFIAHFEESSYVYSSRYHNDFMFKRLCDSYHFKNSCFLPVVLKKVESVPGLSTLWGKLSPTPEFLKSSVYRDRLNSWLFTEQKRGFDLDKMSIAIDRLLGRLHLPKKPKLNNFEQFISLRTLWGTSGSTDVPVSRLYKKTKWQDALLMSDDELMQHVNSSLKRGHPIYSIIPKQEPNTVRAVVLVDLVTYLIESYLSYYLDDMLSDHPVFYNWKSEYHRFKYWMSVINNVRNGHYYLDLDWKNWDENMTDEIYQRILDKLLAILKPFVPDLDRFVPYLRSAVKGAVVRGFPGKTVNGLASGRRWTTLLNSIINAAFIMLACEEFNLDILSIPEGLVTLGDDSQTLTVDNYLSESIMDWLNSQGATINKAKSKITNSNPEFLKLTVQTNTVSGDQVRAVRSILWSTENEVNSLTDKRPDPNLQTRADLWVKLLSRVLNADQPVFNKQMLQSVFYMDLSKKTRIPIPKVWRLVNSAQAYGGLGFSDLATNKLGLQQIVPAMSQRVVQLPLRVPQFYNKVYNSMMRLANQTLLTKLVPTSSSWKYVRKQTLRDIIKIDSLENRIVTVVTSRNMVAIDSTDPIKFAIDKLWLSQLTFDELKQYSVAPISKTLKSSIYTMLSVWSKHIVFDELSGSTITSPPVPRAGILGCGEVLCNHIWNFVWSTSLLPNKLRRLTTASYMSLLVTGQHFMDWIYLDFTSVSGALQLRKTSILVTG